MCHMHHGDYPLLSIFKLFPFFQKR